MNIIISLEFPEDQSEESILEDIVQGLTSNNLEVSQTQVGLIHVLECHKSETDKELEKEPEETKVEELNVEESVVKEADVIPSVDFGKVKVLSLSTNNLINSCIDTGNKNTILKVCHLSLDEDIVRFAFNLFEHALPRCDELDSSIVNVSHVFGKTSIRLVIEIAGDAYPCIVELAALENSTDDVLIIGEDLLCILQKT